MSEDHPDDVDDDWADGDDHGETDDRQEPGDGEPIDDHEATGGRSEGPAEGDGQAGGGEADGRAESGTDPESLAERAAEIRAELDRWETSEDAGDDVDLADAVEDVQRWTTGDVED